MLILSLISVSFFFFYMFDYHHFHTAEIDYCIQYTNGHFTAIIEDSVLAGNPT